MSLSKRVKHHATSLALAGSVAFGSGCATTKPVIPPDWAQRIPSHLMDEYSKEITETFKAANNIENTDPYSNTSSEVLDSLPLDLLPEHADELVRIAQRYNEGTPVLFRKFGVDVVNVVQKHGTLLDKIIEVGNKDAPVRSGKDNLLEEIPTALLNDYSARVPSLK